jgi:hypothetical protein
MGTLTTLTENIAFYGTTLAQFGRKKPGVTQGRIVFAGSYWPERSKNTRSYHDVELAINEARSIVTKAYLKASSAIRLDPSAGVFMTRWFGARNTGTGANDRDWWKGALAIIGAIEDFIVRDVNVYYRGDDSLLGRPNDYPGESGTITDNDLDGIAESSTNVKDNVIGLCRGFFREDQRGSSVRKLSGEKSVGGTLVHELSHNICGTLDHKTYDNSDDCYGTDNCLALAEQMPNRAFYNADNIRFFCEDVAYDLKIPPRPPVQRVVVAPVVAPPLAMPAGAGALPFTPQTWLQKTARIGHTRSADLAKVDQAMAAYAGTPTASNRQTLKTAFSNWYTRNRQERTSRNVDNCVERLKLFLGV